MAKPSNLTLSGIFFEILKDVVFFPFWWYSFGLIGTVKKLAAFIIDREKSLALFVWVKNIFTPMYGQRDWQGLLISFFIRLVQIVFRSLVLLFWLVIALVLFWLWIIFPAIVVYMIFWQITIK
jgi:hypothetical protein